MDVKGVIGNNSWIKLSKMYVRTDLPVDKEQIATPDKIKQWDYLKVIASNIIQTDGIKVGLLRHEGIRALEGYFKCRWWPLHLSNKTRLLHCGSYYQYGW